MRDIKPTEFRYLKVALVLTTNPPFPYSSALSFFMHLASVAMFLYTVPLHQLLFSIFTQPSSLGRQKQGVDEHLLDGSSYRTCCWLHSPLCYLVSWPEVLLSAAFLLCCRCSESRNSANLTHPHNNNPLTRRLSLLTAGDEESQKCRSAP